MEVRNETDGDLTVASFKGSDSIRSWEYDSHWPTARQGPFGFYSDGPGETCYIKAVKGRIAMNGSWGAKSRLVDGTYNTIHDFGPYRVEGGSLVIVERGGKLVAADWGAIDGKWAGQVQGAQAQGAPLLNTAGIAENLLDAVEAAFRDIPIVSPIVSFTVAIGKIILIAQNADSEEGPPTPPNINEISDAIAALLKQELAEFGALEYATSFLQAAHWLHTWRGISYSALWGHPANNRGIELSPHDLTNFRSELHDLVFDMGDFQVKLDHIARNPSWGLFILPAFLVGVAANLHIRWLNDFVRFYDGTRITDRDLEEFKETARYYRAAVDKAKTAFEAFVRRTVAEANLDGTSVAPRLTELITQLYTGHSDLAFVAKSLTHIDNVIECVSKDIDKLKANQPPQYYIKELWTKAKKANAAIP